MFEEKGKARMLQASITPSLCRAARAVVGWSQDDLADRASVSRGTLRKFETGTTAPHANNLAAIRSAFEAVGFVFDVSGGEERVGLHFRETWQPPAADPQQESQPSREPPQ